MLIPRFRNRLHELSDIRSSICACYVDAFFRILEIILIYDTLLIMMILSHMRLLLIQHEFFVAVINHFYHRHHLTTWKRHLWQDGQPLYLLIRKPIQHYSFSVEPRLTNTLVRRTPCLSKQFCPVPMTFPIIFLFNNLTFNEQPLFPGRTNGFNGPEGVRSRGYSGYCSKQTVKSQTAWRSVNNGSWQTSQRIPSLSLPARPITSVLLRLHSSLVLPLVVYA